MSDANCSHQFKDGNYKGCADKANDSDDVPIGGSLSYYKCKNFQQSGIFTFAKFFDEAGKVFESIKMGLQVYETRKLTLDVFTHILVTNYSYQWQLGEVFWPLTNKTMTVRKSGTTLQKIQLRRTEVIEANLYSKTSGVYCKIDIPINSVVVIFRGELVPESQLAQYKE